MSIEYETVRCENGETVPKDDYSGYYGCGGYAIRGPEDEQLAGRLDALLEKKATIRQSTDCSKTPTEPNGIMRRPSTSACWNDATGWPNATAVRSPSFRE